MTVVQVTLTSLLSSFPVFTGVRPALQTLGSPDDYCFLSPLSLTGTSPSQLSRKHILLLSHFPDEDADLHSLNNEPILGSPWQGSSYPSPLPQLGAHPTLPSAACSPSQSLVISQEKAHVSIWWGKHLRKRIEAGGTITQGLFTAVWGAPWSDSKCNSPSYHLGTKSEGNSLV